MSPLPPNVAMAAEKLFAAHRASGTFATAAATDDLRALLERFGIPWIPFDEESHEAEMLAAFDGEMPELTEAQWQAIRAERSRLGRMLTDSEAREVIRCAQ